MYKVGIIGLGLIGGSIAKALKKRCSINIVALSRTEASLIQAYNEGILDSYSTLDLSIFKDCNIIFICTPVDKITYYVDKLLPYIDSNCIITDVGSAKQSIYNQMLKYDSICFIGGHPMAGSEQIGYKASKEHLFENAYYILAPMPNTPESKINELKKLLDALGALIIVISAQYHDYIVAAISHVPHIIAAALVNMVKNKDDKEKHMHMLAAGGFKDITRIVSSSPEMWSSICQENKDNILKVIASFKLELENMENEIKQNNSKNIYSLFNSAKEYRDTFAGVSSSITKNYEIIVDICDKPGVIATIATMLSVNNINIKNIGIINSREYTNGVLQIILESEKDITKSAKLLKDMNFSVYVK